MKKFLTAILMVLVLSLSLICLFGCGDNSDKIDGKYMFTNSVGQSDYGMMTYLNETDEDGKYINVIQSVFVPENFWVEIDGTTMTVHGSISPVTEGKVLKFNVNPDNIRTIENFTLKTSTSNKNWYSIYDERGDDTLYIVLKDGNSLVFKFGKPGDNFWYNITYDRA